MPIRRKLIEVSLPLDAINAASAKEKSIRHGHPSTLHLWWARRPLAAARAVLFGQLVDDPSAWPDKFPTSEAQEAERKRLHELIERMVPWEASNNEEIINDARREIAKSHARALLAGDFGPVPVEKCSLAERLEEGRATPEEVNEWLATELPPVHDPFAGGGTIPLEAQRLGLRAIATDLNPVAVLINKALIEIPPRFAGMPPVNPESRAKPDFWARTWKGAEGLAEDVRYYGRWMRDEAKKRIGHLYPEVDLPPEHGGGKATVIAWLWARTVASPNPAFHDVQVPLVSSFWLSMKEGKKTWVEPVVDGRGFRFLIRTGEPRETDAVAIGEGTKSGRGDFRCILSGSPIPAEYIREKGKHGALGTRLLAVVVEGKRGRIYLPPNDETEHLARVPVPDCAPETNLPEEALGFRIQNYGMKKHQDLFTPRQLLALSTFAELVAKARENLAPKGAHQSDGAEGDSASRRDAIAVYLALALDRCADFWSTIATWSPQPKNELVGHTFTKQALPMTWDFGEINPFSESGGNFLGSIDFVVKVLGRSHPGVPGIAVQGDAIKVALGDPLLLSTDPPYYDNIGYADLSDYFYVWLRQALRPVFPELFATMLVPKEEELIAAEYRHGSREEAEAFFLNGMGSVLGRFAVAHQASAPAAIYYAFKQSETTAGGTSSTGWATFLQAILDAGWTVDGTWPVRTERPGRSRDIGSNALASSVVLVCRKRDEAAAAITRGQFLRTLRVELPSALAQLQAAHIAPVDVPQSAIGPGMAIFSRHRAVLDADDRPMTVRMALELINQVLDEYLGEHEGEMDADSRFAVTWFETFGYEPGQFGEAENLAKARNVSVAGIAEAGIISSAAGKVRIIRRDELNPTWNPAKDSRLTVWEATQQLIRAQQEQGEDAASRLLAAMPNLWDGIRGLAYRLYTVCERKGWAEEGRAYNGLVAAWPDLEAKAAQIPVPTSMQQEPLFR